MRLSATLPQIDPDKPVLIAGPLHRENRLSRWRLQQPKAV